MKSISRTNKDFANTAKNTKVGAKKPGLAKAQPMKRPPEREFFKGLKKK
jgi:hypothetical protein